jgi:hypothetical protein
MDTSLRVFTTSPRVDERLIHHANNKRPSLYRRGDAQKGARAAGQLGWEAEMKGSMQAAMTLGVGYALGRRKKFRTATLLAAATAFGSTGVSSLVLRRGMKMLASTDAFGKLAPQLGEIADTVRGDLLDAGKAAVGAAVSNRVDSLTSSIHERADRLRNPADAAAGGVGEATEAAGTAASAATSGTRRATSTAGGAARKARGGTSGTRDQDNREQDDRDQDDYEADDLTDQDRDDQNRGDPDDYDEGEPDDYAEGEPDDDEGEPDDDAAPAGRPTRGRPAAPARRGDGQRRSPVSRARR